MSNSAACLKYELDDLNRKLHEAQEEIVRLDAVKSMICKRIGIIHILLKQDDNEH